MSRTPIEEAIDTIEGAASALTIIADACGNGAHDHGGERTELALSFIADTLGAAVKLVRSERARPDKGGGDA